MSNWNTQDNHPLIANSNNYFLEQKMISIHSGDRDIVKFPLASEFEIELPQDYTNVHSLQLLAWSFPSNYYTFSKLQNNISLVFSIIPIEPTSDNEYYEYYNNLYKAIDENTKFIIEIEEGFYDPIQLSIELTRKMNEKISIFLYEYFTVNNIISIYQAYNEFVVAFHAVSQKMWFGNKSTSFILHNDDVSFHLQTKCITNNSRQNVLPEFDNWGLPFNLGFTRKKVQGTPAIERLRFYYGDVFPNDNGYWIVPNTDLTNSNVYYLEAPLKINIMGPGYFYMEMAGFNYLDETSPYCLNEFTSSTNITTGIVNSAFAKICIPTCPLSQWFDNEKQPIKYFDPPAERIRRLKLRFRYHNGFLVDFASFEFSFTLQLNILRPQIKKKYNLSSI
jgi:hypothetical protein